MNDNELIKAIDSINKINKDKLLKEKFNQKDRDINNEGFSYLLDEEMDKLKNKKEVLKSNKDYLKIIKQLYEKESKHKKI